MATLSVKFFDENITKQLKSRAALRGIKIRDYVAEALQQAFEREDLEREKYEKE